MGISDGMKGIGLSLQSGAKNVTRSAAHIFIRTLTGLIVSLTLGLICQELMKFGVFGLLFFIIVMTGVIFKLMSLWSLTQILIFDIICILVAMLFRMYILVAP